MKQGDFVQHYFRIDEDGDYVFQTMPCSFLDPNNFCKIYEVRPQACVAYPHTNEKNVAICPAVTKILIKLNNKIKFNKLE